MKGDQCRTRKDSGEQTTQRIQLRILKNRIKIYTYVISLGYFSERSELRISNEIINLVFCLNLH